MVGNKRSWTSMVFLCVFIVSNVLASENQNGKQKDIEENNFDDKIERVQRIQQELQEIFSKEKPYQRRELENEMKEAIADVMSETQLDGLETMSAPSKRFEGAANTRSLTEDASSNLAKKRIAKDSSDIRYGYLNDWVVHLEGGPLLAEAVLRGLGYGYHGQITGFDDLYRASHQSHPRIHKRAAVELTKQLNDHHQVVWAEQQISKVRVKRSLIPDHDHPHQKMGEGHKSIRKTRSVSTKRRNNNAIPKFDDKSSVQVKLDKILKNGGKLSEVFNDKMVAHQWYLYDTRMLLNLPRLDLGVTRAWLQGYTGAGVKVAIIDDGLDHSHDDLKKNYDPTISYDFNDDDNDPAPRIGPGVLNSHGTKCAGEVAMEANNRKCGVGVAYNSRIGAIRMLDGPVSDRIESESLSHGRKNGLDIAVCSWGPNDDGATVEGPHKLASAALVKGVEKGRDGKGLIYVWASGNGGMSNDNCNCDGYASSIYTLSVNSASSSNKFPWYGERCASTMTSTYSSGAYADQNIITTDLQNQCTSSFAGTSAAAPLAAGVLALALEANANLTWRDAQHITVLSSNYDTLSANSGWSQNAMGLYVSLRFGFGLLDAEKVVFYAKEWEQVPKKVICTIPSTKSTGTLASKKSVIIQFDVSKCQNGTSEGISLEHVQVVVSLKHSLRGALEVNLQSARGTNTTVLTPRIQDKSKFGFDDWPFMSVHTWGEDPRGTWYLNVTDTSPSGNSGEVTSARLVLHATESVPIYAKHQYQKQYDFHKSTKKYSTRALKE